MISSGSRAAIRARPHRLRSGRQPGERRSAGDERGRKDACMRPVPRTRPQGARATAENPGRSPSYMFRQLYDFRHGARTGEWSPLMAQVVSNLETGGHAGDRRLSRLARSLSGTHEHTDPRNLSACCAQLAIGHIAVVPLRSVVVSCPRGSDRRTRSEEHRQATPTQRRRS